MRLAAQTWADIESIAEYTTGFTGTTRAWMVYPDQSPQFGRFARLRARKKNRGVIYRPPISADELPHAYVTPDFPQGISYQQWKAAEPHVRLSVAVSWFLQNHSPDLAIGPASGRGTQNPLGYTNIPEWLNTEFEDEVVLGWIGTEVETRLYLISGVWNSLPTCPLLDMTNDRVRLAHELLARIEALELALGQAPGIGHNDPPLTASDIASLRVAAASLAREVKSTTPDAGVIASSADVTKSAYVKVGKWVLQRLEKAVDESIKWGIPFGMAEAVGIYQRLGDVFLLARNLLKHLVG